MLLEPLQKSSANSLNSISQLKTSVINLENLVQKLLETNQSLVRSNQELEARLSNPELLKNLPSPQNQSPSQWRWISSILTLLLLVVNLMAIGLIGQKFALTAEKVNWILIKFNRQECIAGIKKRNSPECAGLL